MYLKKFKKQLIFVLVGFLAFASVDIASAQARRGKPADFLRDADLTFSLDGYGRLTDAADDLRAIALGMGMAFESGYAFGIIGVDASMYANIGRSKGFTEILEYNAARNRGSNIVDLNVAALKLRYQRDFTFDFRIGYTPLEVGTIGTSGELNTQSYQAAMASIKVEELTLAYAIANRFNKEWDTGMHDMRGDRASNGSNEIDFIHSVGVKYNFGMDKNAHMDLGFGHGHDYRYNALAAFYVPVKIQRSMELAFDAYGFWGKYITGSGSVAPVDNAHNEYHFGGAATFTYNNLLSVMLGQGWTDARDSGEMNFRLTAYGSSDGRDFVKTTAQINDFVEDDMTVTRLAGELIFDTLGIPGLVLGVSYTRGWDTASELDYFAAYEFQSRSDLHGFTAGVYVGHYRREGNNNADVDDIKGILSYTYKLL